MRKKRRAADETAARLKPAASAVVMAHGSAFGNRAVSDCINAFMTKLKDELEIDIREIDRTIKFIESTDLECLSENGQWLRETRAKLQRAQAILELDEEPQKEKLLLIRGALFRLKEIA